MNRQIAYQIAGRAAYLALGFAVCLYLMVNGVI
jgi:hypothetical protein